MAKHPVPKYKTPKRKSKSRYSSFARKTSLRLLHLAKDRIARAKNAPASVVEKEKAAKKEKVIKKIKA